MSDRRPWMLACAAWLVVATPAVGAVENTVYRCGQTYQQLPCPAQATASERVVDASDPRTAAQRAEAKAAAAAQKRQARSMVAERLQREKSVRPQQAPMGLGMKPGEAAASAPEAKAPKAHTKKKRKKTQEPDRYVAPPGPSGKG